MTHLDRSKKKIQVEAEIPCDTGRLYGSIDECIAYLTEMRAKHGDHISLDEEWTGYEDMHMRFVYMREETDTEYAERQEAIKRQDEWNAEKTRQEKQRAKDLKELNRLKSKLGIQ